MRDKNQSPAITVATPTLLDRQDLNNQLEALLTLHVSQNSRQDPDLTMLLPDIKKAIAEACLEHTRGNQSEAARLLGINRYTLKELYYTCLEDFITRKKRINNIGHNNLSYKTEGGVLVPHRYDRPVDTSTYLPIQHIIIKNEKT